MQLSKQKDLALLLLGLTLLTTEACSDKSQTVAAAPVPPHSTEPAVPPKATASDAGFTVSGPLIVEHQLDILAQRDGVVAKVFLEAGAHVRTGDLLAQLDDRQLTADLEAARAKTRSIAADLKNWEAEAKVLEADYERAQKLWDAHVIPYEQLQHAQYKAESDQWDILRVRELLTNAQQTERSLALEMEKTRIRVPFDGVVARRYVREGQQVARGDRLFWVTAEAPLRMRFTLPEKFVGVLKIGQLLPLTFPDLPAEQRKAKVVELSPVVDPSSGTFDGMVQLSGAPGRLRPGMSAVLRIDVNP